MFVFWIFNYWRNQQLRIELAELNKQKELLQMRQNLSQNIHDDIGSGLSRIALLSQLIKNDQDVDKLDKLKSISQNLSSQLGEMIWSINPGNDTLSNLLSYIRFQVGDWLEESTCELIIDFPDLTEIIPISPEWRNHFYLITKEAINNALKYAQCTSIQLQLLVNPDGSFQYTIQDNGKGFDEKSIPIYKNGLNNMKKRAQELGATATIKSTINVGTTIIIVGLLKK
jgi:signal transduction histidine kinase